MRGFRSLRTHLIVVVLGSGLFVAVPLMLYGRWVAVDVTERLVLENGRNQVEATVGNLDRVLHRVEQAAVQIACVLEDIPLSEETLEGEVRCVNAGHLPPLAVEVGGRVSAWEGENGLPLGLFDGTRYEVQQHVLSVGAMLLLYTDGVTEALDEADRLFTEEALQDHLVHSQTSSAAALAESVMEAVASHRGQAAQSDDVALLAVRRLWTGVKP